MIQFLQFPLIMKHKSPTSMKEIPNYNPNGDTQKTKNTKKWPLGSPKPKKTNH